jgi:hypothetical protein
LAGWKRVAGSGTTSLIKSHLRKLESSTEKKSRPRSHDICQPASRRLSTHDRHCTARLDCRKAVARWKSIGKPDGHQRIAESFICRSELGLWLSREALKQASLFGVRSEYAAVSLLSLCTVEGDSQRVMRCGIEVLAR